MIKAKTFCLFILTIFLFNTQVKSFNYYKFEDRTKNFIACDMNTAILVVLTDRSIILFSILSRFRDIREPMFLDEIDFKNGISIKAIEYNIFVSTKDDINIFRFNKGKIEFLKKIEEKNVVQIEKSYLDYNSPFFYFYKDNSISIYNDFFNKIKEEVLDKNLKFVTAKEDESLYRDKSNKYYVLKFDKSLKLNKSNKKIDGDVLYFGGDGFYISKDGNEIISIYNNFELTSRINPYKDLKKLANKENMLSFKINKVLPMRDKLCITGEMNYEDQPTVKCTLIYDEKNKFCKTENPSIAEIFGIDVKYNQFSDIVFLAKNFLYYFCHGFYYSCGSF